jgi:hypothetical protein
VRAELSGILSLVLRDVVFLVLGFMIALFQMSKHFVATFARWRRLVLAAPGRRLVAFRW